MTRDGRVAVLTNFRDEGREVQAAKSRGAIVKEFLMQAPSEAKDTESFLKGLVDGDNLVGVGGFSLVCGNIGEPLAIVSNCTSNIESVTWVASSNGETLGLSNAAYRDRSWPKVVDGERLLAEAIANHVAGSRSKDLLIQDLFRLLTIDTLPRREPQQEWDSYVRQLRNSIFIPAIEGQGVDGTQADEIATAKTGKHINAVDAVSIGRGTSGLYGTQKQTVLLVDHQGWATFVERTLFNNEIQPSPEKERDQIFEFLIEHHVSL